MEVNREGRQGEQLLWYLFSYSLVIIPGLWTRVPIAIAFQINYGIVLLLCPVSPFLMGL